MSTGTEYPLFLGMTTPLSRRRDPGTSGRGAEWIRKGGRLARQEKMVLEALKKHEGMTARELARIMGCADVNVPARRLSGLRERALVRNGDRRVCSVSKMTAQTWYVGTLSAAKPSAVSRPERREPVHVLTPLARQKLLEEMAAAGDVAALRVLHDRHGDGQGGCKHGNGRAADRVAPAGFLMSKNGESSPVPSSQTATGKGVTSDGE